MSRGPWVSDRVGTRIEEVAELYPKLTPWQIREQLVREFEGTDYFVPGPDGVRRRVNRVRQFREEDDSPWSLADSGSPGMAPEVLKDVMAVWKDCLIGGDTFTVRHAKWVARLSGVVPERKGIGSGRVEELYRWALIYTARERTCRARQTRFDTTDLDARIAFEGETYRAIQKVHGLPHAYQDILMVESLLDVAPKQAVREWRSRQYLPGKTREERQEFFKAEAEIEEMFESIEDAGEAADAHTVWRVWIAALSQKGEKWPKIESHRKVEVAKELVKQVVAYCLDKADLNPFSRTPQHMFRPSFVPSDELLAEVGYKA